MIMPPGTLLQQMYFRERLRRLAPGRFVEVGAGQGVVSRTLLDFGWRGRAYDLNGEALAAAAELNRAALSRGGRGILFVPGCPDYWGMEDEIAGHLRRYTFDSLREAIEAHGLRLEHMAGLTYPLSNLLFPLSEYLVRRAERHKLALSHAERTRASGSRSVPFKTDFPAPLRMVLNEVVLYPLHLLQKLNARNPRSMVLYAEFSR